MKQDSLHTQVNSQNFFQKVLQALRNGIIPFLFIAVANVVSWGGNQLFGPKTGFQPNLPIDAHIPFVSWFILFYYFCFPVAAIAFFVLAYKNKKRAYDISFTVTIALLISGIVYFFWQTEFPMEWKYSFMPEHMSFFDRWTYSTWNIGIPTNLLPSQHCIFAFACILTVIDVDNMSWWYRICMAVFNVMVLLATVFLKQHFVLDAIASLAIINTLYLIARLTKFGEKVDNKFSNKKIKFKK